MTKNLPDNVPNNSAVLFYQLEDGSSRIQVRLEDKTVRLSQIQIAELFQTSKQNTSLHINNIFEEQELAETATVKEYLTVQTEGGRHVQRKIAFYSLDIIMSVGYRVKSHRGAQFRRWATERLREYLIKGFVMDDERLKNPKEFGADYLDSPGKPYVGQAPRLIEHAFPLKQASLDSVHEKNVRHGHISPPHIWPTRRPKVKAKRAGYPIQAVETRTGV